MFISKLTYFLNEKKNISSQVFCGKTLINFDFLGKGDKNRSQTFDTIKSVLNKICFRFVGKHWSYF